MPGSSTNEEREGLIEETVRQYQEARRAGGEAEGKRCFILVYESCLTMLWDIAWKAFRRCRHPRRTYECLESDQGGWFWKGFNFPLINGLGIALDKYDPLRRASFRTFAYSVVQRTLLNHCQRDCPWQGPAEEAAVPVEELPAAAYATPFEQTARRQRQAAIIQAVQNAWPPEGRERVMLALYFLGAAQKDIAFLMNRLFPRPRTTETAVSRFLNERLPEALTRVSPEVAEIFPASERRRLTADSLGRDPLFPSLCLAESEEAVGIIKDGLEDLLRSRKADAGGRGECDRPGEAEWPDWSERYFSELQRDGRLFKALVNRLREAADREM